MNSGHDKEQCHALAERLSEYIDGELPDDVKREINAHFDSCVNCQVFLESLLKVKGLGRFLRPVNLTERELRRLAEAVRQRIDD